MNNLNYLEQLYQEQYQNFLNTISKKEQIYQEQYNQFLQNYQPQPQPQPQLQGQEQPPKHQFTNVLDFESNCPICLELLITKNEQQQKIITLPCNHHFHQGCINEWLKSVRNCPMCKS